MQLEPRTLALMRNFFRGHRCWRCGEPAVRFFRRRFCCHHHIQQSLGVVAEDCRVHRALQPSMGRSTNR